MLWIGDGAVYVLTYIYMFHEQWMGDEQWMGRQGCPQAYMNVHEEWMCDRAVHRPIYVYTFTDMFVCIALDVDVDGMGLQSRKLSGVV